MRNLKKEDKNCWGGKVGIWMTTKPQREKKKKHFKVNMRKKKKKAKIWSLFTTKGDCTLL